MSTKRRISVDVHPDTAAKLNSIALEKRVSVPEVCRVAVDVFLFCYKAKQEGRRLCFSSDGAITELVVPGVFLGD